MSSAAMGDRAAAEDMVRRGFPDDAMLQNFALGRVAWHFGDYSEAVRRWSAVGNSQTRYASPAKLSLEDMMYALHLSGQLPSRPPRPFIGDFRFGPRAWMSTPPSESEWRWRNRSRPAALVYHAVNIVGAKLMLNSGRASELVATYDSPTGLLGIRPGDTIAKCQLLEVPVIALALRQVGRGAEAEALLRQSDALIRHIYRGGKVPAWFDQDAAAVWAVQGKNTQAIVTLDRSFRRGWVHGGRHDLPKIEDEPAFRLLRGDPRFEALRRKYEQHLARERVEAAQVMRTGNAA
jgi:hypothetical protein